MLWQALDPVQPLIRIFPWKRSSVMDQDLILIRIATTVFAISSIIIHVPVVYEQISFFTFTALFGEGKAITLLPPCSSSLPICNHQADYHPQCCREAIFCKLHICLGIERSLSCHLHERIILLGATHRRSCETMPMR